MSVTSASPADPRTGLPRILVWDAPVRVFHWLMVLSFVGAYLTAESERWRLVHVTLGYTMAGLVTFRIVWGLIGTRHARFASFVRGPVAVLRYLRSMGQGRPEHHAGHNPAGAVAIALLLGLAAVVAFSGWSTYNDVFGEWTEDLHELAGNLMLAVVLVHVAGVALGSWLHHENLVRAMVDGFRQGTPREAIDSAWRSIAALMLIVVLAFWTWQWQSAPVQGPAASAHHDTDQDDD